jgi:hypothetical protein
MQQSTMIITVICIPLSLCSSFKRQKTFWLLLWSQPTLTVLFFLISMCHVLLLSLSVHGTKIVIRGWFGFGLILYRNNHGQGTSTVHCIHEKNNGHFDYVDYEGVRVKSCVLDSLCILVFVVLRQR